MSRLSAGLGMISTGYVFVEGVSVRKQQGVPPVNTCINTCYYACNALQKKLTITIDETVYNGLYRVIGPRKISAFIEDLVRPHVTDLDDAYREMAADEARECDAVEWVESLGGESWDEGEE